MRLLKITTLYPAYLDAIYAANPGLAELTFHEQKQKLDFDASGWADFWSYALGPLGYDVLEVSYNAERLQRAWAKEQGIASHGNADLKRIVIEQAKCFKPEVLWFDDDDEKLLVEIRATVPSICCVLGWTGSAVNCSNHWKQVDLALSCAQESVDHLRSLGMRAEQLHHGFDPRIISRLTQRDKLYDFTFIGQLVRRSQFHLQREQFLLEMAKICPLTIFSASARLGRLADTRSALAKGIYTLFSFLKKLGFDEGILRTVPYVGVLAAGDAPPLHAVNPALRPYLKPDIYGLEMFQMLKDSRVVLNIHADSSPRFASNMRLFETTGVGACIVTDWKENIADLFVPDHEVVTYKSVAECREKVRWLLDHPEERERIAAAAQMKTLKCHTFSQRAVELDGIIKRAVQ